MPLSPNTLTRDEQRRILAVTSQEPEHLRDHMLLAVALGTGLRLHEILALNVGDVSRDGQEAVAVEIADIDAAMIPDWNVIRVGKSPVSITGKYRHVV